MSDGFGDLSEPTFRYSAERGLRFVPPTIEELASEFPQLEIVRLLGSGGMGAVYLANQVRLARPVAVKILPPDLADDAAFSERFLREARALARLSHPNIVGVFDFGHTPGGLYYFLMEYIEGPTLRQIVANRSADPKQALEIVRQVCDALQYAHDKGVVHRDIKPENVLLDSHGRVKIADFGLAKLLGIADTAPGSPAAGSLTGTRQAMGTPHYMAPEQIMGSRGVDHRADIYSLGVVFYELLTGELPLGRFAPPSRKVQIDVRLDEVVLRTLEAEPEQRYQRAGDVKTDVETISSAPPRTYDAPFPAATRFVRETGAKAARVGQTILDRTAAGQTPRGVKIAWACVIVAVICMMLTIAAGAIGGIEAAFIAAILFGWIGLATAVAATAITVSAIGEIRRSGGRLTGLVGAVAVALVLPFAVLDLAIWFVCLLPGYLIAENILRTRADDPACLIATLIAVPATLLVDFCVLRSVWQWATRGMSPELVGRELSVIPPELQELGSKLAVFCDKSLRALKPIQRRHEWHSSPSITPRPVARYTPPVPITPPPAEKPILRPVDEPLPSPPASWQSRRSRKAVIGAAWLAWIQLAGLFFFIASQNQWNDAIELPLIAIGALCSVPAMATPFVTTILGWLAVGDIRRSRGRLTGLPLAVFDGMFFPLLLLDGVLFALAVGLGLVLTRTGFSVAAGLGPDGSIAVVAIPVGLVACVLVDFVIVKAVWTKVRSRAIRESAGAGSFSNDSPREGASFVRRHREVFAAGAAIGFVVVLVGLKAMIDSDGPGRVSVERNTTRMMQPVIAQAADTMGEKDVKQTGKWYLSADGPKLGSYWSNISGPLGAEQQSQIDAILQKTYADYVQLLEEHIVAERKGDGVTFTIDAFPRQLDDLTNRFWSEVDPLLSRDQQGVMRYNFPLRFDRRRSMYSSNDIQETLFLFGGERATITIERTGQWFRWSISGPTTGWSSTTPELPRVLSGWERRLDRVLDGVSEGTPTPFRNIPVTAVRPVEL